MLYDTPDPEGGLWAAIGEVIAHTVITIVWIFSVRLVSLVLVICEIDHRVIPFVNITIDQLLLFLEAAAICAIVARALVKAFRVYKGR